MTDTAIFQWVGFKDHFTYDQSAVLYAVRGLDGGPVSDYWILSEPGRMKGHEDGKNTWKPDPDGPYRYLKQNRDPKKIAKEIERLMKHLPE